MSEYDIEPCLHIFLFHLTCLEMPEPEAIISGDRARLGDIPHMALVHTKYMNRTTRRNYTITCGGSIIDRKHIVTAAHCV